jgi:hypothetical protein
LRTTTRYAAGFVTASALLLAACGTEQLIGGGWTQVREVTTCEALNPSACVGAAGFTVRSDGTWVAGPSSSGATANGTLTATEKTLIASDVSVIDSQRGTQCDAGSVVPGVSDLVEVTLLGGDMLRVFEKGTTPNQTCFRGGRDAAGRLHDDVTALMAKYYPKPFA